MIKTLKNHDLMVIFLVGSLLWDLDAMGTCSSHDPVVIRRCWKMPGLKFDDFPGARNLYLVQGILALPCLIPE